MMESRREKKKLKIGLLVSGRFVRCCWPPAAFRGSVPRLTQLPSEKPEAGDRIATRSFSTG